VKEHKITLTYLAGLAGVTRETVSEDAKLLLPVALSLRARESHPSDDLSLPV
jgi:hypothetical protein